ncbi:nuclease-related domain-containing protein [Pseudoalteromonas sp. SSM20]|uniref:nuclease-related domain-containing protein n=1 Tax=Pseudoalteromonas sp. SSM20 TaxID=3139394 RepID=UPI003BAA299F
MSDWETNGIAVLVAAGGIYIILGVLFCTLYFHQKRNRLPLKRSSLTRLPAQKLNQEIADTGAEILGLAGVTSAIVSLPFIILGVKHANFSSPLALGAGFGIFISLIYAVFKAHKHVKKLILLKLGRDAELAVAGELVKLQAKGFQIFHDVQADNFNIDHLAVGTQGIFAIETKGRHKRTSDSNNGQKDYKLVFQKGILHFPSWVENKPIEQAERQAKWVNDWLVKSTGIKHLNTTPVLTFPGWWVELKSKPPFPIVNHKQLPSALTSMQSSSLTSEEVSQICYQIVQRCTSEN